MAITAKRSRLDSPTQEAVGGYDAFVSYSHHADGQLAPALQQALQTMAKPWYRRRALRIFRDKTSLTATPELWGSMSSAGSSRRSSSGVAAAAAWPWVEQEAAWWRAHRANDDLYIALTDGELDWDAVESDFTDGSAVPPSLHGWFASEPLWVDLRWVRTQEHLSPPSPVPGLRRGSRRAAARPAEGRARRRGRAPPPARHPARRAARMLLMLTALAAVGAVVAIVQRNAARDQSSLATARQIAATATGALTHGWTSRMDWRPRDTRAGRPTRPRPRCSLRSARAPTSCGSQVSRSRVTALHRGGRQ